MRTERFISDYILYQWCIGGRDSFLPPKILLNFKEDKLGNTKPLFEKSGFKIFTVQRA